MESVAFAAAATTATTIVIATLIVFKTRDRLAFGQLAETHRPRIKDFLLRSDLCGLSVRELFPQASKASVAPSFCCLRRCRLARAWGLRRLLCRRRNWSALHWRLDV